MDRFLMDKDGHLTRNSEYYERLEGKGMKEFYMDTDSVEKEEILKSLNYLYGKQRPLHGKTYMVPKEMEATQKIGVTVWTMSKQKIDRKYFETETLLSATRIVNTFKPKRNHKIVKVEFEEVGVLV